MIGKASIEFYDGDGKSEMPCWSTNKTILEEVILLSGKEKIH